MVGDDSGLKGVGIRTNYRDSFSTKVGKRHTGIVVREECAGFWKI